MYFGAVFVSEFVNFLSNELYAAILTSLSFWVQSDSVNSNEAGLCD
jgi:hypothetical protein